MEQAFTQVSHDFFASNSGHAGIGSSSSAVAHFAKLFPESTILAMGAAGADSNLGGSDEQVNLAYCKRLTGALSHLIGAAGEHH